MSTTSLEHLELVLGLSGVTTRYQWRSENGSAFPAQFLVIDDTCTADQAFKLARAGTYLIWNADFQNARQLLQAISRRLDKSLKRRDLAQGRTLARAFDEFREDQKSRAQLLGKLLIPVGPDHKIHLKRAPLIEEAAAQAYGRDVPAYLVSLRELQGVISAFEWRKKGVTIDLSECGLAPFKIAPHFGVFSPIRGEYLRLVASAPLPVSLESSSMAFDIGTGTGVLSLILALRGVTNIVATDLSPRAIACALGNIEDLKLSCAVKVIQTHLYPTDPSTHHALKAALIVCNPPWLPAPSSGAIDSAVFDPDSQMLKGFLNGLSEHLLPQGEGWLILSDLAEHLGLRSRGQLTQWIDEAGLEVLGRLDIRPEHKKARDPNDPFYEARSQELTSLWRLGVRR